MAELGDAIEKVLRSVGISPESVEQWLGKPCNCEERKQKLNRFSRWIRRFFRGKQSDPKQELEEAMEE